MRAATGGDAVVAALTAAGVEVVFGIPSVHNLPIYDAIRREGSIRAVTVRHEQAASGAADGYARTTGQLGVCITSTGPGAANAMGGQLEAYVSSTPILHLTGQIDSRVLGKSKGYIHEVPNQAAMLGSLAKRHCRPESPEEIATLTLECAETALGFPSGPVSLEIPIDFQYASVEAPAATLGLRAIDRLEPLPEQLEDAATLIAAARRPLVWAGGGAVASGAAGEVAALVRMLRAGLLTTPNGRGIMPEGDPLSIGNLSRDPDVQALCRDADLLVAVGTRFQGPNTENWAMQLPRSIVQIDVDPDAIGRNYVVAAPVVADARVALGRLEERISSLGSDRVGAEAGWAERVAEVREAAVRRLRSQIGAQEALLDATQAALRPDTVVVKDATIPAYTWGNRLLAVESARTSIVPNGFAIGLGLPHAIGAGLGIMRRGRDSDPSGASGPRPEHVGRRKVVLMVGDGGFMLAASELATIAQEQLEIVVVVFVDGGYGILRNIQDHQFGVDSGRIGVELKRPDFVALAAAFGVPASRVESPVEYARALGRAMSSRGPSLVEVDLGAIGAMSEPYIGTSRPPTPD